jgi:hypothetical protein
MNVGCVLCFDNGWFASFVAKLFKMFGDNGYKFFFGIVFCYLQFVEEKYLQSQSGEAFKI